MFALPRLVETEPDDDRFADWCGVWAASQLADRPSELPRPVRDHVALARQVLAPGGSRDGTHRAALLDDVVVGAVRLILPTQDNPAVASVDVAVHPDPGVAGSVPCCSTRAPGGPRTTDAPS